jgi:hypothetical protein
VSPLRSAEEPRRRVTNHRSTEKIAPDQTEDDGTHAENNGPPPTKPRHAEPHVGEVGDPDCQKHTGSPEDGFERRGARKDRACNERRKAEKGEQSQKTGRRRNLYGPRQRRSAHRQAEQSAPRPRVNPL